jgi:hypothetical protein
MVVSLAKGATAPDFKFSNVRGPITRAVCSDLRMSKPPYEQGDASDMEAELAREHPAILERVDHRRLESRQATCTIGHLRAELRIIELARAGEQDANMLAARTLAEFGVGNDVSLWRH